MEIKEISLDLVQATKEKNVWKLESEAFKDPLTLKIWYDSDEKKYFEKVKSEVQEKIEQLDESLVLFEEKENEATDLINKYSKEILLKDKLIKKLESEIAEKDKKINGFSSEIDKQNHVINSIFGELSQWKEHMVGIIKIIAKQPSVYHYQEFISWSETFMKPLDLEAWNYLRIKKVKIIEKNEFVENECWTTYEVIHINQWYIDTYKLEWWTEFDTPTATVDITLTFIPF